MSQASADAIDAVLPQTQCRQCGFDGCLPYAHAIAEGRAEIDRCPPGGDDGIAKLAAVTGRPMRPLDTRCGVPKPLALAVIDESLCIGCTLCIKACPVDAIVGAAKQMHTIIPELCTGCDLCVPPCPVDCIAMIPVTGDATGWDAWSQKQADAARDRHDRRIARLAKEREAAEARAAARQAGRPTAASVAPEASEAKPAAADDAEAKKRAIIQAALERARKKKEELAKAGAAPKNTERVSAEVQAQIDAAEERRRRLGLQGDEASANPAHNDSDH